ncbi:hypothetical protein QOZ80_3AG0246860 [Eleusine coracana subsp. coracana]|nr:hypothetical protein QOZ80_3AG0246860 [Eleusine coracana subsp. coracana]
MSSLITPLCGCPQQSVIHLVLFLHQFVAGPTHPNRNEEFVIATSYPHGFGTTLVNDWYVTNTSDPNGFVVARAQGLHMQAGQTMDNRWYTSFNLVFQDDSFAGSTLQVMGIITEQINGEWSIMGGTGQFKRATGNIGFNLLASSTPDDGIRQLDIDIYIPKAP